MDSNLSYNVVADNLNRYSVQQTSQIRKATDLLGQLLGTSSTNGQLGADLFGEQGSRGFAELLQDNLNTTKGDRSSRPDPVYDTWDTDLDRDPIYSARDNIWEKPERPSPRQEPEEPYEGSHDQMAEMSAETTPTPHLESPPHETDQAQATSARPSMTSDQNSQGPAPDKTPAADPKATAEAKGTYTVSTTTTQTVTTDSTTAIHAVTTTQQAKATTQINPEQAQTSMELKQGDKVLDAQVTLTQVAGKTTALNTQATSQHNASNQAPTDPAVSQSDAMTKTAKPGTPAVSFQNTTDPALVKTATLTSIITTNATTVPESGSQAATPTATSQHTNNAVWTSSLTSQTAATVVATTQTAPLPGAPTGKTEVNMTGDMTGSSIGASGNQALSDALSSTLGSTEIGTARETATNVPNQVTRPAPLVDQIMTSIQTTVRGQQKEIVVQLNPPELGRVAIRFTEEGNQLVGVLEVSEKQTRQELEQALPQIIQNLESNGIQVKKLEILLNDQSNLSKGQHEESDLTQSQAQEGRDQQTPGREDETASQTIDTAGSSSDDESSSGQPAREGSVNLLL